VGFSLQQFSEVFKIRDGAGQPYLLVGGQAVNYWAERYLVTAPELAKLQPFTSEDIDFKGTREDVDRIARQLDSTALYPHRVAMTALAGIIPLQVGGLKSSIEVVRRLPGIPDSGAVPAITAEFQDRIIRVLDPISLLACKLELVAKIPQKNRQDVAHLRILVPCVREFLAELLEQVTLVQLSSRDWLKVTQRVLKLTRNSRTLKLGRKHGINWVEILPLAAVAKCADQRIRRFYELQCSGEDAC
jgi:hypothetical protein